MCQGLWALAHSAWFGIAPPTIWPTRQSPIGDGNSTSTKRGNATGLQAYISHPPKAATITSRKRHVRVFNLSADSSNVLARLLATVQRNSVTAKQEPNRNKPLKCLIKRGFYISVGRISFGETTSREREIWLFFWTALLTSPAVSVFSVIWWPCQGWAKWSPWRDLCHF